MILLDDKYVLVEVNQSENYIYYVWKGFVPSNVLKETLNKVLIWIEKYELTKIVSNAQKIGVISQTDQEWLANTFATKMMNSTIIFSAVILPTSVFGKMSGNEIIKKSISNNTSSLITKYFDSKETSLSWVREIQK